MSILTNCMHDLSILKLAQTGDPVGLKIWKFYGIGPISEISKILLVPIYDYNIAAMKTQSKQWSLNSHQGRLFTIKVKCTRRELMM